MTTQAVILAAGVGSRLRPLTEARPKAALSLCGQPLIARALKLLADNGVSSVVVVAGYRRPELVASMAGAPVRTIKVVENPAYDSTNTLASLICAAPALEPGDFFLLDGDLIFESSVLRRLRGRHTRLAVDRSRALDADAVKVGMAGHRITAIGKELGEGVSGVAESIGIAKIDGAIVPTLLQTCCELFAAGERQAYYEAAFERLIAAGVPFEAADVTGLKWVEIDDHDDLARARMLFAA